MQLKRKLAASGLALAVVFGLTGCVSFTTDVQITSDSEASLSIEQRIDKAKTASMSGMDESEILPSFEESMSESTADLPEGVDYKLTEDEEDVIFALSFKAGYDEKGLTVNGESLANTDQFPLNVVKDEDTAVFTYDVGSLSEQTGTDSFGSLESIYDAYVVTVTFPGEVVESNLDAKVEGSTVTWELDQIVKAAEAGEVLTATGKTSGAGGFSLLPIVIGILVLGLIGGGVFFFLKNRKDKDGNDQDGGNGGFGGQDPQFGAPQAPQGYGDPNAQFGAPQAPQSFPQAPQAFPQQPPQAPQGGGFPQQPNGLPPRPNLPPLPPRPGN
jgi:hypothetical protein